MTIRAGRTRLLQTVAGFGQAVEPAPYQPVHGDHHERDQDGGQQDDGEFAVDPWRS